MTAPVLGLAALCTVLCLLLLAAVLGWRRDRAKLTARSEPVTYAGPTPLYDRVAAELGTAPARPRPWSAGDETDVAQIIKAVR